MASLAIGWTHTVFPIDDASRIGEARRFAASAVHGLDWSDLDTGRLAIVVTELGTNLLRHARAGRLLIAARPGTAEVEVIAIDEGPGIPDLRLAMRDGHSSGSTPGTGLGAVRRLSDDFDLHSTVPDGTVCVARVRRRAAPGTVPSAPATTVQFGAVCVCAPGESVCGDGWAVASDGHRTTVLLADGLGHGPEAAVASRAAVQVFAARPFALPEALLDDAHTALQTTRGAALCCVELDTAAARLQVSGAGNVMTRVVSGVADRTVVTQHGTVGLQMRRVQPAASVLPPYALVVVHSDGIASRWPADRIRPLLERDPTLVAAVLVRDHTRHRDDACVVVLRRLA